MSGFKIEKTKECPEGALATKGQTVVVHYHGTLNDIKGLKFDASRDRNKPFKFKLGEGQVIKGWDVGFASMRVGEEAILTCPPDYAYGARGAGGVIPPNATLAFQVEMLDIEK